MKLTLFLSMAAAAFSTELTPDTYDAATAGKTVFLKFFAPWCGHCKKMKPDWDKLMTEYADHATILIADVDCTAGGKPLCDANDVKGFPTLKYGDPSSLEAYEGGRDATALAAFAADLKPSCSPANMDLCDDESKADLEKLIALSDEDIAAQIAEGDAKLKAAEATFSAELEILQATYKQLMEDKETAIAEVKKAGLSQLKAVAAHKKNSPAAGKEEL